MYMYQYNSKVRTVAKSLSVICVVLYLKRQQAILAKCKNFCLASFWCLEVNEESYKLKLCERNISKNKDKCIRSYLLNQNQN